MYPHERSLVKQLEGKPFALIGVNSDRDLQELKKTIKEENLTWRSFQDAAGKDGVISKLWGIREWPTMFLIDADGVIRWTGHNGGNLDVEITKLLAEIGHDVVITHEYKEEDSQEENDDADAGEQKASSGEAE